MIKTVKEEYFNTGLPKANELLESIIRFLLAVTKPWVEEFKMGEKISGAETHNMV